MSAIIHGPEPVQLNDRSGLRYWAHDPFAFTGHPELDDRLSGYPIAIFQPARPPGETPVVFALQGMAAPYQWNGYLVPTLLDMGIACVLFDTPLGGERSVTRAHCGDVLGEARAFARRGVLPRADLVLRLMTAVARDYSTIIQLLAERHNLTDSRRALFGVSLGALLSGYAFMRDSVGERLLAVIGHTDLDRFARSYVAAYVSRLGVLPVRLLGKRLAILLGPRTGISLGFLAMIAEQTGHTMNEANPMTYLGKVSSRRRARFLVGADHRQVRAVDAVACARRFADGECYVVPGLGHGHSHSGPSFVEHVRTFVGTQLGDWKW